MSSSHYKRVMLKLSGEILQGDAGARAVGEAAGIYKNAIENFCREILEISESVQIALVIGGGNFWRFRDQKALSLDRTVSDNIGMLATIMNALALQNVFSRLKRKSIAFSSISTPRVIDDYTVRSALIYLQSGSIVICAGGTGNPFFSTDSAAALRGLELGCDILLKATNVDYVYDKDPKKFRDARKFEKISFQEVLERGLQVMDLTAISLCRDGNFPIRVFNMEKKGNLKKAVFGEKIGTLICNS